MRLLRFARNDRIKYFATVVFAVMVLAARGRSQVTITPTETTPSQETVHRAKNLNLLTDEEKLHVPVIVAPTNIRAGKPFRIQVIVGKKLHPMTDEHHIEWVEVLVNDMRVTLTELTLNGAVPDLEFSLVLQKNSKISVFARCNSHGIWEGNLFVKVRVPTVIPKKTK